ncbi:MAG TPA: tRNA (adenosine(37)-N6)-threonylcarbamoyltransferase complex dimerization subunit type 1 TsaB [bacterium]|nr:tRNA (adenosine(37)-N6)-threonylcarbamoyltransferase complex dimerization subunit type 1 TsaB [bacterium]HPL95196.1 tRNA (adenosine(37)-N6)-threonylcarbamoyltransferase complex dimerization subunit type 1 TsaB [bacterium]
MYLYLNTTDHNFIHLALIKPTGQILVTKKISAPYQQSEKLLLNIQKILTSAKFPLTKIAGIIVIKGPGGFTSLRIGLGVANALAWSLQIPIVGVESKCQSVKVSKCQGLSAKLMDEDKLIRQGLLKLKKTKYFKPIMPKYGSEPHITIKNK